MNATSVSHEERKVPIRAMTSHPQFGNTMKPPARDYRQILSDTPLSTAPSSPQIPPKRQDSGSEKINRVRPTTLDIPGLTSSKASPDGRIAERDVGSKLVIVMVGLPARGKSYITKKLARYLNWLQHDTKIFNVGNRRRVAAAGPPSPSNNKRSSHHVQRSSQDASYQNGVTLEREPVDVPTMAARILSHDAEVSNPEEHAVQPPNIPELRLPEPSEPDTQQSDQPMDQSAAFFDPHNEEAFRIREQCALDTLDELLEYILYGKGSVGILDATNSTLERRRLIMDHIRERAGSELNVLFIESTCLDESLLERNIRLKLSGPDYIGKDPEASLRDFKQRIEMYQESYVPLGHYEEMHHMPYVQMIDVGRKMISHQIRGFIASQAVYYLTNFNLAPRQIWITRHGQSVDNVNGKIGGDAELTIYGNRYAEALTTFLAEQREKWELHELEKRDEALKSPLPGDTTPPNPYYIHEGGQIRKNFCVWTSMLKRSVQTAQYFDEDEFDIKAMKMLDEINAGHFEGLTYDTIKNDHRKEYDERRADKLRYRYPGPGGESYLDIINRLRPVIVELERMTDHVLLIGHRGIARVLLAYFKGLSREEVADLDVPIGVVYCLEPKPYGVDFKAFRYNDMRNEFEFEPDYKLQPARSHLD